MRGRNKVTNADNNNIKEKKDKKTAKTLGILKLYICCLDNQLVTGLRIVERIIEMTR